VIPRHWRSGWHRMWPNSAFHDVNSLPHSVHGGVSPVGEDRTLANAEEVEEGEAPSGRGLRACRGFVERAQGEAGGGSASARVSVVSWCGGGGGGGGGRGGEGDAAVSTGVSIAN
jgi:hypothetical protein